MSFSNVTFQSIDFNNITTDNSSQVTIHKRNRNGDENKSPVDDTFNSSFESDLPKKKKYKIVPNTAASLPTHSLAHSSMSNTASGSSFASSSYATKTSNESTVSKVKVEATTIKTEPTKVKLELDELPKDRKDLLKFVCSLYLYVIFI